MTDVKKKSLECASKVGDKTKRPFETSYHLKVLKINLFLSTMNFLFNMGLLVLSSLYIVYIYTYMEYMIVVDVCICVLIYVCGRQ